MWHVYIIECSDGSLYTGITTDIKRRMKEHNGGRGASYTRARTPVKLVRDENCDSRSRALKREAEIKSWPRNKKLVLVKNAIAVQITSALKREAKIKSWPRDKKLVLVKNAIAVQITSS